MFTTKLCLGLVAIAAGGFLDAGMGQPESPSLNQSAAIAAPTRVEATEAWPIPDAAALQSASGRAVLAEVRHDLRDNSAKLRLSDFRFDRVSSQSVEGTGHGLVLFDESSSIPIVATAVYDLSLSKIERVSYQVAGSERQPGAELLGKKLRDRIADLIGSRLVLEFSQQPVDFSLLEINRISAGQERIVIGGNGITRFPGEGAAFTRFTAVADKSSGRILTVKYELLQEMQPRTDVSLAEAN